MQSDSGRPVVGIPCDVKMVGPHPFHAVGEKYIAAVSDVSGAIPILLPVSPVAPSIDEVLRLCDGVLLTGSWSNVDPGHYGGPPPREGNVADPQRDAMTLPLIPAIIDAGVPLFGICRGFQEMNVVYGGALHQHLHEVPGRMDHRENKDDPLEKQYGPAHPVKLTPGGTLQSLLETDTIDVNSVHGQGIDQLGNGLAVEAEAPDGTIEAFRVKAAETFALAVQWHPEWQAAKNPVSRKLFQSFGEAVRAYAAARGKKPVTV